MLYLVRVIIVEVCLIPLLKFFCHTSKKSIDLIGLYPWFNITLAVRGVITCAQQQALYPGEGAAVEGKYIIYIISW